MLLVVVTVVKAIQTIAQGLAKKNHTIVDTCIATWIKNHNNDRDKKGLITIDTQTGSKTPQ
jgi:hypothetical protein